MNNSDNTFIACRIPYEFKEKIDAYARSTDATISQMIRRGLRLVMEQNPSPKQFEGWSVRR